MANASSSGKPIWRPMTDDDLGVVNRIANETHKGLPERPEVFADKLRAFPDGCFILVSGGNVVGYALSHPWRLYDIPPLDSFLRSLPTAPTCFYIHDVVVTPDSRGHGSTHSYVELMV